MLLRICLVMKLAWQYICQLNLLQKHLHHHHVTVQVITLVLVDSHVHLSCLYSLIQPSCFSSLATLTTATLLILVPPILTCQGILSKFYSFVFGYHHFSTLLLLFSVFQPFPFHLLSCSCRHILLLQFDL